MDGLNVQTEDKEKKNTAPVYVPTRQYEKGGKQKNVSKSFEPYRPKHNFYNHRNKYYNNVITYDAVNNCRAAGVIPYSICDGVLRFLFQKPVYPIRRNNAGWNDFGGKQNFDGETTVQVAAREFNEETNCLFYVKESEPNNTELYESLKDNIDIMYSDIVIDNIKKLIPIAQCFFENKIIKYIPPVYVSSKETYISYFVKVEYLPAEDIPRAEDIHENYEYKYLRACSWFDIKELDELTNEDFNKRLQITKIKQRIKTYHEKGFFV